MSRVFEALTKAAEEKQYQAAESSSDKDGSQGNDHFSNRHQVSAREWDFERNGNEREVTGLPITSLEEKRSWRERIEELVFGWDLRRYSTYPIVALEKDSPASEQYKILREQIKKFRMEAGIHNFTVTSPVKKDGKTTVTANLAAALALDYEEKVLLIDGDLRAPTLHRYFNIPEAPGLTDYLSSNSRLILKDLVQDTFLPGLRLLPAGNRSHLSSELLARERMKQVMEEARAQFPGHQIIIDSPPVLSTPDPMVIARHVEGILLVMRASKTPRDYLTKALQSLNSSKVMGVVLNGVELGMASKYYYYSTNGA
jgi:capsular exopolysaccharide synthesis family protein